LVSCPCDVTAWRKHMQSVKGGAIWERPVRGTGDEQKLQSFQENRVTSFR